MWCRVIEKISIYLPCVHCCNIDYSRCKIEIYFFADRKGLFSGFAMPTGYNGSSIEDLPKREIN